MLYSFLKIIVRITVWVYFRKIHVRNAELVPQGVPLIITPNHPSSYMDIMVVAPFIKKRLHFIMRGESFNTTFKRWLLDKLNLIPIYRKDKTPELMHKNKEVFEKCYRVLAKNGALIMFPEGISKTERRLREIKTGAARIALGAEAANKFELKVAVVPVGLNYSDPHMFQSELFINFAKSIDISQFFELYQDNEHKGVVALTEHIKERLEKHTIAIENGEMDELVKGIETIYKRKLNEELGLSSQEKEQDFLLTKEILEAVRYYHRQEPVVLNAVKKKIRLYMSNLKKLKLKDRIVSNGNTNSYLALDALKALCYLTFGFPVYVYGVINNLIAYKIPGFFASRSPRPDFYGSITMTIGMATFIVFYTMQIWLVALFSPVVYGWWIPVVYAVSLPITGISALYYHRRLLRIRDNWLFISLFYRKTGIISSLIQQRQEIVEILEKGKQDYYFWQHKTK